MQQLQTVGSAFGGGYQGLKGPGEPGDSTEGALVLEQKKENLFSHLREIKHMRHAAKGKVWRNLGLLMIWTGGTANSRVSGAMNITRPQSPGFN